MLATARERQADVAAMTGTSFQQQLSVSTGVGVENVAQQVLSYIAFKCFQNVDPSNREELNGYLQYMRDVRKVLVVDTQQHTSV